MEILGKKVRKFWKSCGNRVEKSGKCWNPCKIRRFWYDWWTYTDRLIILTLQKRDKARGWGIFLWSEKLSESSDNGMECTVVLWSTLEYMVKKWSQMLFPKCILIHTHAYCVTLKLMLVPLCLYNYSVFYSNSIHFYLFNC